MWVILLEENMNIFDFSRRQNSTNKDPVSEKL